LDLLLKQKEPVPTYQTNVMQEQNIFLDIAPYIGTKASHPANGG